MHAACLTASCHISTLPACVFSPGIKMQQQMTDAFQRNREYVLGAQPCSVLSLGWHAFVAAKTQGSGGTEWQDKECSQLYPKKSGIM